MQLVRPVLRKRPTLTSLTGWLPHRQVNEAVAAISWQFADLQWPFLETNYWRYLPIISIYKAYVADLCKGISPENMAQNMALNGTVPPF